MNRVRGAAILALFAAAFGCGVPGKYDLGRVTHGSRARLSREMVESLRPGLPRSEVLMALGEPDLLLRDGRRFVYAFSITVNRGWGCYSNPKDFTRFLVVDFDDKCRIARVDDRDFILLQEVGAVKWD